MSVPVRLLLLVFLLPFSLFAQIPRTISYQGVLTDAQGNLVPDGNHQLQIVLYDQATGGNQVFVENQTVPVVKGIFNAIIGSVAVIPQSLSFDRAYFLGVSVNGGSELTPRTALTAVPYALRAERANIAESLSPTAAVVTQVNNQSGDVTLLGAGSTTITNNGNQITVSSTGGTGSGIAGVQSTDGTIAIQNPNGPVATIGIANESVTPNKISPAGAQSGQALIYNGSSVQWSTPSGGSSGVSSLNNVTGAVTLAASGGATVSTIGNTITINAGSGSGGTGIQGIQNTDNTLSITNPGGPTATINVKNQGITTTQLADGSVNSAKIQDGQVQTSDIADNAITGAKIPTGQVVKSINTLKDDVTLAAGSNVTITPSGNTLTIAASGGGTSPWAVNGNDISNNNTGNVGIGRVPLAGNKLDVNGATRLTPGGSGGEIILHTPSAETGMTIIGTNRADLRFDGSSVKLLATTGTAPPASTGGIIITTAGNVGIGTTAPSAKLHVEGGISTGVYGTSSNGDGVYGESGGGGGVYGTSVGGTGMYGYSSNGTAVRGIKNGGGNYAGSFFGNVNVAGTLSKTAGAFKIDHPLDPANKYLWHSFVESPDMKNIYDGVVTLDANGEAIVQLPEWFEALNKDFRYQLTCIGGQAIVYVSKEISNNGFAIAGGNPGMKVSWQITGIRHDPFAEQHRIPVEEMKTGKEAGKYLYPKEHGVSETLGVDYEESMRVQNEMKQSQEREANSPRRTD